MEPLPDPGAQLREAGYEDAALRRRPTTASGRVRPRRCSTFLSRIAQASHRPRLVVDLGSGTGLSTRAWAGCADEVVGVEPLGGDEGRRRATRRRPRTSGISTRSSYATGRAARRPPTSSPAHSRCSGWSPSRRSPRSARILRPRGVFCAYEYCDLRDRMAWEPGVRLRGDDRPRRAASARSAGSSRSARSVTRRRWSASRRPASSSRVRELSCSTASRAATASASSGLPLPSGPCAPCSTHGVPERRRRARPPARDGSRREPRPRRGSSSTAPGSASGDPLGRAGPYVVAFTTRAGGVSEGPYARSTSAPDGDDPSRVDENRRRACAALGARRRRARRQPAAALRRPSTARTRARAASPATASGPTSRACRCSR